MKPETHRRIVEVAALLAVAIVVLALLWSATAYGLAIASVQAYGCYR
jgi:hypothetical protein